MKDGIKNAIIAAVVRHLLSALGVAGTITMDEVGQLAAATATVGALAWSIWEKIQASKKS